MQARWVDSMFYASPPREQTRVHAAMRYVGIIERPADGPRYEDAYLASKPRGSASRTPAASAHHVWCRSRYVIELPGRPARVPAVLYWNSPSGPVRRRRAERRFLVALAWLSSGECVAKFSGPGTAAPACHEGYESGLQDLRRPQPVMHTGLDSAPSTPLSTAVSFTLRWPTSTAPLRGTDSAASPRLSRSTGANQPAVRLSSLTAHLWDL